MLLQQLKEVLCKEPIQIRLVLKVSLHFTAGLSLDRAQILQRDLFEVAKIL